MHDHNPLPSVQTKTVIRDMLKEAGLTPDKRFGQHFLIDGNLMRRLVDASEVGPRDLALEVGAGTGGLTDLLVRRAGRVVAVELHHGLRHILTHRFADCPNVEFVFEDVLESKHRIRPAVLDAVERARAHAPGRLMLAANLPYQVATPLLLDLLLTRPDLARMCFTVQREVADRLEAGPGSRDYGPISIMVQATCTVQRLAKLPPHVFWPAPNVDSAMLRCDVDPSRFPHRAGLRHFSAVVRSAFLHRRKTLRWNLLSAFGPETVERIAATCRIDLGLRPEQIPVDQYRALSEAIEVEAPP